MNIKINRLFGIRNQLEFDFENSAIIFAPNGSGKSSLAKGFRIAESKTQVFDMEKNLVGNDNLAIDNFGIMEHQGISVFDSDDMKNILSNPLGVIKGFLKWDSKNTEAGVLPRDILDNFINVYEVVKNKMFGKIQFSEVEFPYDSLDGVEAIMSIIEKTGELDAGEFEKIKNNYNQIKK